LASPWAKRFGRYQNPWWPVHAVDAEVHPLDPLASGHLNVMVPAGAGAKMEGFDPNEVEAGEVATVVSGAEPDKPDGMLQAERGQINKTVIPLPNDPYGDHVFGGEPHFEVSLFALRPGRGNEKIGAGSIQDLLSLELDRDRTVGG
jgi:hypothetical protein